MLLAMLYPYHYHYLISRLEVCPLGNERSGHVLDVSLGDDYSWGCGYPGDKETVRWMKANLPPLFGEPPSRLLRQ